MHVQRYIRSTLGMLLLANALAYLFVTGSDVNLVAAVVIAPFAIGELLTSRRALLPIALVLSAAAIVTLPSSAFASAPRRVICLTAYDSPSGHWYGDWKQRPRSCVFHKRGASGFHGDLEVTGIVWKEWGEHQAFGRGTYLREEVQILLQQPSEKCGRSVYGRVALTSKFSITEEVLPVALYGPEPC